MAANNGVPVRGPIVTPDTADVFPTHFASNGFGGFFPVADNTARDAIPEARRAIGMLIYVVGTTKFWQLRVGITNADWVELAIVPV